MKDMEITLVFGQMKANQKHKKSAVFQNVLENHVKTGINKCLLFAVLTP